ncbi:MAG: 1-(5-phosphoribosyl)-5-[(5-phosphoribosylamino)methylideneamino]imidazole-4-carboxamide isomerase [Pelotomaculum sp.]|uniref:1-(5-phosphoribosyl)-5-[(5-phosphoribosylamino)methylideneamino] imidazole-4-carboxamide isomerase n=1 Tax=Pelotomaculum thermopropionicum (strain DSM 13744 / JCM 10971 / SI) TaxID=370438 RepID=HIS4_PELTS|nr:RecName: Full=1-(5-phosphoribosyl)-5-[(5-phosphoribosylamino)methylideneamino] imidazole-4-carboxamide isomerase; AltName: Full=Phosphoribosylformimino-5-aminoimidazole carboxamide ribotide isomerase [Pelotomaculum thermopropionicum SI]NPV72639.1 1-(5-phosphoribosyl)-5-[(5-phosphoribosylamino)methylideneamino]imidazole-4-carboxamide isomerase [Pelotomaculum sp.]BAF60714.1 phosphoribosylformimino-5-aminoimidazole carboxamide ribonucleotide (ProFAR) isomerase [Pelotomaculum thermopropionicum SI]
MLIIPAIDLREGNCVRLVEGRLDRETVYSGDPVAVAGMWQSQGARMLHVVDLDGAFSGAPKNLDVIGEILSAVSIPVQVGGGIRSMEAVERLLELGAARVILGTAAILKPQLVAEACARYGEAVLVGIDGRNGRVAIEGWGVTVDKGTVELALEMKRLGIKRAVFTDIRRDGTLRGPNLEAIREFAAATGLKVIASGGVSNAEDLRALKKLEPLGVEAVIMGKALYAGTVKMSEALAIASGEEAEEGACCKKESSPAWT